MLHFSSVPLSAVAMAIGAKEQKQVIIVDKRCFLRAKKLQRDLKERVKELRCLYNISSDIEYGEPFENLMVRISQHSRQGLQFPRIATVRIEVDGKIYSSVVRKTVQAKQEIRCPIEVAEEPRGGIYLGYSKDEAFLQEEQKLLKEVARMITKVIEKKELEDEIRKYVENLEELVDTKTKESVIARKRYQQLFENTPDAIVISRLNGDVIKANPAFYNMLRFPEDNAPKLNFITNNLYKDPTDRDKIVRQLEKNQTLQGYEFNLLDKAGQVCPVIGSFNLIRVNGESQIEAIYKDIRLRKTLEKELLAQKENLEKTVAERTQDLKKQKDLQIKINQELVLTTEELRTSKNKLQTFFNAITDAVVMIDRDFHVLMSNRTHHSRESTCYQLLFGNKERCADCPGLEVFNQDPRRPRPVKKERKQGNEHFMLQAYPVISDSGKIEGAIEFCREITKDKAMEMQLRQADKLASLGQLVSGIAHEINNPNTFIRGNISIIKEAMQDMMPLLDAYAAQHPELKIARLKYGFFKETIFTLISDMLNGANRIKRIVTDLRKFARKDEGLITDEVDLNAIIESCTRLVKNQVKRNAAVTLHLAKKLPHTAGNVQKLEQVVVNLLLNASQAMGKAKGVIDVRTWHIGEHSEIAFSVQDNGKGMDENTLRHIFNPFFTTKSRHGGTGLGLSIAYGIIKEHDGRIKVTSEPGEGTTVTVYLPVKAVDTKGKAQ